MTTTDNSLAVFHAAMRDGAHDHITGKRYEPGVDVCVDNAEYLDGYSGGWQAGDKAARAHAYTVTESGSHGYPYQATCPCGWRSNTYAAAHAAHDMGQSHQMDAALSLINPAN